MAYPHVSVRAAGPAFLDHVLLEPGPFLGPTSKNPCPALQVDPVPQVEEPLERRGDRLDHRVLIEQIVAGATAGDEVGRAPDPLALEAHPDDLLRHDVVHRQL